MRQRWIGIWLLWLACGTHSSAQTLSEIKQQLDLIFDDPAFSRAWWGVKVQSMDSGATIYERNAEKLVMPASNMKLLTAVAAVQRLGLDYRFQTELRSRGEIKGGVLQGDLTVIGSGDPSLGARLSSPNLEALEEGDALRIFKDWAAQLKGQGIHSVAGDLVGDDAIFDRVPLGSGWSWDDLPYGYSAEMSGLQFNENIVLLRIMPGSEAGEPVSVQMVPATAYLQVSNQLETAPPWEDWDYRLQRGDEPNHLLLLGTVPAGEGPFWRTVSVEDPTLYFLTVLREVLETEGISIGGRIRRVDPTEPSPAAAGTPLIRYQSPELKVILRILLKVSQNLYAETLVKMLDPRPSGKSYERGRREVEATLTRVGIAPDSYQLADGSGLSRLNLVTPEMLVRLLQFVYRAPYCDQFRTLLPLAGVDGTIKARLKGTVAEGNVQAKTGTLSQVRALAGFVTTQDGETLAFATVVNHYLQPRRSAEYLQDLALQYLASINRSGG